VKIAADDSAPYTVAAAPKLATQIAAPKRLTAAPGVRQTVATSTSSGSGELARARDLLAAAIRRHPILKGSTVEFGDARGYQAICYYKSGRIVVSRSHTASLDRIINHEIWHIIDWRDNGRIDWGESVPPK
jgi:hypothetical protein